MSVLLHVKNIIIHNLKMEPEVKKAVSSVLNAIDSDLDEFSYVPTMETDETIEHLDKVLAEEYDVEIEESVGDVVLERNRRHNRDEDDEG